MNFLKDFDVVKILLIILALIISIVGHEIMHGLVAYKYGDNTAKNQNRLSINPLLHVDIIGTILLPLFLFITKVGFIFGYAKPVPIRMSKVIQNGGYLGAILVSLAGIFYNFTLAILCAIILHVSNFPDFINQFLFYMLSVNVFLGIFNLYPIPPLDGFNALCFFLAYLGLEKLSNKLFLLSKYGMVILILIIATPISKYIFFPMNYIVKFLLT